MLFFFSIQSTPESLLPHRFKAFLLLLLLLASPAWSENDREDVLYRGGWGEMEFLPIASGPLKVTPTGDPLRDWTELLLQVFRATRAYPPPASRALAIFHIAIHDALAAADNHHQPILFAETLPTTSTTALLVSGAAHEVITALFPARKADADALLALHAGDPSHGDLEAGRRAARAILEDRADDGASASVIYTPTNLIGRWRPTRPGFRPAISPQFAHVRPFALAAPSQYRCPPPPPLQGDVYARDHEEVRLLGDFFSTTRTAEQTDIVYFWADEPGTFLPPGHWTTIALNALDQTPLSMMARARVMATVSIALADAAIAGWDSKYHHDTWRPYTAIVLADQDGNPATTADPNWSTLIASPPHPEYPSGHAVFSTAAARVLEHLLGPDREITVHSDLLPEIYGRPNQVRRYSGFMEAAHEAADSRILGGLHFRYAAEAGINQGIAVADHVVAWMPQPAPADTTSWILF